MALQNFGLGGSGKPVADSAGVTPQINFKTLQAMFDRILRSLKGGSMGDADKLRRRFDAIGDVLKRSGGEGNLSLADLGITLQPRGSSGPTSRDFYDLGKRIFSAGDKLIDDPAYGDRIVATERAAQQSRQQSKLASQFRNTFFNPKASRGGGA